MSAIHALRIQSEATVGRSFLRRALVQIDMAKQLASLGEHACAIEAAASAVDKSTIASLILTGQAPDAEVIERGLLPADNDASGLRQILPLLAGSRRVSDFAPGTMSPSALYRQDQAEVAITHAAKVLKAVATTYAGDLLAGLVAADEDDLERRRA